MSQLLSTVKPAVYRVRVCTIHMLSPRIRYVVSTGTAATNLTDLAEAPPGAAIRLMFLHKRVDNGRTFGWACTIRRYHAARGELEIDFVVYDETPAAQHGPAARWLGHVAPGDEVEFVGPKWGFCAGPAMPWTLLIGDETMLPAIFAILGTLPGHAQVLIYIAIGDARARLSLEGALATHPRGRNIHWVEGDTAHAGVMMARMLSAQAMSAGTSQVFSAGGMSLLKQVHTLLEGAWTVLRDAISARGYWTAGLSCEERKASEAC